MRMRGTCLFCACAQPRSSVLNEIDLLGGLRESRNNIAEIDVTSVCAWTGLDKVIQSNRVPRKHGYVSQAPYVDKLMKNGLLYNG